MYKTTLLYCATDKEVFDLLMSAKKHFSETTLRAIAAQRGIFCSEETKRHELAEALSVMTFGYHELVVLQEELARAGRGEKTTSFRLKGSFTASELKAAAWKYINSSADSSTDQASTYVRNAKDVNVEIKYTETDFSKTRLRQRRTREACIEFNVENDHVVVTLPATDKAREVANKVADYVNEGRAEKAQIEDITLTGIDAAAHRSNFFTDIIINLPGFTLKDVSKIKIDRFDSQREPLRAETDDGTDEEGDAAEKMLGIVKAVALQGSSLLSSPEYQNLTKQGFFITSLTWSSKRNASPYEIVEFDAGFDSPMEGEGFRYAVHGWFTQKDGKYTKSFRPMPSDQKALFLTSLEKTAADACNVAREDYFTNQCDVSIQEPN